MNSLKNMLTESSSNDVVIDGIKFITKLQTSGRSYIKWQFIPKTSKDLDRFSEGKEDYLKKIEETILKKTGFVFEFEDDGSAGVVFYIDRWDLEEALIKKLK